MEYVVGTRVPLQRVTVTPFAVSTSECNVIAAITLQGVHLFEILAATNRVTAFKFQHRIIPTPTEINPTQNTGANRSAINRDIKFEEIHDVFLDRTLSAARVTDEPLSTAFRQVTWSPSGLIPYRKCILATITADHRVTLYRNSRWAWDEIEQLSSRWLQHMREHNWTTDKSQQVESGRNSLIYSLHKNRSYLLGTMALGWSPLYIATKKWSWLIMLQRSGHIVVWKVIAPVPNVDFSVFHDLMFAQPSVLKVHPGASDNELLVFVGSHLGCVKCWSLSWKEDDAPICHLLGTILPYEDSIPVTAMEISSSGDYLVVTVTKNNVLVAATIKCNEKGLQSVDLEFTILPGLQLTGLSKLAGGSIVCVTEDYQVNEIDMTICSQGFFKGLKPKKLGISTNPNMLCRGITAVWGGDNATLIAIESVKVSYDHLKCRQPTNLVVYVNGDVQRVTNVLETALSMGSSLVALETYKALHGQNWEAIWELDPENMMSEDNYYLQLLRWFALYKCNACFVERRFEKDFQDVLKLRAEKAEFCLQLRHIASIFSALLDRKDDTLTPYELMNVSLAYKFVCTPTVTNSEVKFDKDLAVKIQAKYRLDDDSMPKEECPICQKVIPFESREEGQCANEHRALRCRATLRTCYENTFSCLWCGIHYHLESGLDACILCGGPVH